MMIILLEGSVSELAKALEILADSTGFEIIESGEPYPNRDGTGRARLELDVLVRKKSTMKAMEYDRNSVD
jgi:hypothetical protein